MRNKKDSFDFETTTALELLDYAKFFLGIGGAILFMSLSGLLAFLSLIIYVDLKTITGTYIAALTSAAIYIISNSLLFAVLIAIESLIEASEELITYFVIGLIARISFLFRKTKRIISTYKPKIDHRHRRAAVNKLRRWSRFHSKSSVRLPIRRSLIKDD